MANDAVAGNALRVAPAQPGATDDPVRGVLAAFTKDLIKGVDETLAAFLAAEVESLTEIDAAMGGFAATARDSVLAGGKRVRPTFAYWGWRGVVGGEEPLCSVLPALSALELLHTFALVHDDVMDASDTRRGLPTAHRAAAARHRAAGHTGDPDRYGEAVAVLIGDLCMVWADRLMAHAAVPAERLLDVRRCYDQMRVETVAGQFLDVLGENDSASWTVDRALRVARYKTASYTVQRPLLFGACLAGADADDPLIAAYTRYGLAVGEAFQLRDDLLGVFGDPEETGKPAGDDLVEGKRTVLVALALDNAAPADAAHLDAGLGTALSPDQVEDLRAIIDASGAHEQVEAVIGELATHAVAALDEAAIDDRARGVLRELASSATQRAV